jgi:hypothetical protein
MRVLLHGAFLVALMPSLVACEQKLDAEHFQRKAERLYVEANPGFSIRKRRALVTYFVRGDQVVEWDTAPLFAAYQAEGSRSAYFDALSERLVKETEARRRTLSQARSEFIPILKSGTWVRVQDLGAIGPRSKQDQLRPWRRAISDDVFVLLGVPEELLGYRYVSVAEVGEAQDSEDELLKLGHENLRRRVKTATGAVELRNDAGQLRVLDMPNVDGISARILDPEFRAEMLAKFGLGQVGAAIPNRDVLILFEPDDFTTKKPVRARTHELYDARNHPGFRGLLIFDREKVWELEPANPEKPKPAPSE